MSNFAVDFAAVAAYQSIKNNLIAIIKMKKIFTLILSMMMAVIAVHAQTGNEFEFTKTVSAKLHLEDNLIVANSTKLFIDKVTIIYKNEELATAQYLYKGDDMTIKKYDNNALAQFRGEELTVKIVCKEAVERGVQIDALLVEDDHDLVVKIIVPKKK